MKRGVYLTDGTQVDTATQTRDDSWHFRPVRRRLTLANVQGQLNSIEMRCDHKRFTSEVSDAVEWHMPESWGSCRVHIFGEPGTRFDVYELPPE